ncbi:MAG: hypothetical protein QG604_606 [Candidatus Dependentiae bacterium]|nr:hypothetical protein [Candidatus Dependentiae bacterium]
MNRKILLLTALLSASHMVLAEDPATITTSIPETDEAPVSDEIITSILETDEAPVSDEILTDMMESTDSSSFGDDQGLDDLSQEKIEQLLAELERENPGFMDQLTAEAKTTEESTPEQSVVEQPTVDEADEEEEDETEEEGDSVIKE